MNAYAEHADGLRELQTELGGDCPAMWYSGKLINILPGGALAKSNNSPGGFSLVADLQLTVLCADFGDGFDFSTLNTQAFNYPGADGELYRVDSTIVSPNSQQVKIIANSAAEGL